MGMEGRLFPILSQYPKKGYLYILGFIIRRRIPIKRVFIKIIRQKLVPIIQKITLSH